jgi:hypothetical protein
MLEQVAHGATGELHWITVPALQAFEKVWTTYQSKGTNSSECLLALLCLRTILFQLSIHWAFLNTAITSCNNPMCTFILRAYSVRILAVVLCTDHA